MSVRRFLAEYFTFTRTERIGVRVLLLLIGILLLVILLLPRLLPQRKPDYSAFDRVVAEFLADTLASREPVQYTSFSPTGRPEENSSSPGEELQPFDPNGLSTEQWMALGLSRKQAEGVKKYEVQAGPFRTKEDVQRIRLIPERVYQRIAPLLRFTTAAPNSDKTAPLTVLDLNTATAEDLQTIRGIGEKLGPRIVSYRDKLGGFHSVEQLKEVYGLSLENYEKIAPSLRVEHPQVKKLHLNYAGVEELGRHPYIGFDLARKMVAERNRNGFFSETRQIVVRGLADEQLYAKLVPYLTVQ